MPLCHSVPRVLALALGAVLLVPAPAALAGQRAQDGESGGWRDGRWQDPSPESTAPPSARADHGSPGDGDRRADAPQNVAQYDTQYAGRNEGPDGGPDYGWRRDPDRRFDVPGSEAWLADCRQRVSARDDGAAGAVIGGVVGGVAGNRIAGRGNRLVGTVAGAAVGAVAGSAIDRAGDRRRNRDECEAYLEDYYARYEAGMAYPQGPSSRQYAYSRYAPAYPNGGCCAGAPVMMVPVRAEPECTETIEYIYEDVPVRPRAYRPAIKRTRIVADKRARIAPDKRIRTK